MSARGARGGGAQGGQIAGRVCGGGRRRSPRCRDAAAGADRFEPPAQGLERSDEAIGPRLARARGQGHGRPGRTGARLDRVESGGERPQGAPDGVGGRRTRGLPLSDGGGPQPAKRQEADGAGADVPECSDRCGSRSPRTGCAWVKRIGGRAGLGTWRDGERRSAEHELRAPGPHAGPASTLRPTWRQAAAHRAGRSRPGRRRTAGRHQLKGDLEAPPVQGLRRSPSRPDERVLPPGG